MPKRLAVVLDPAKLEDGVAWEGWGTSLAWFAVALGGNAVLREQVSTLLFSKDPYKGLGMNIVRYNIGGACQEQAHDYRTGAAVPCFRRPDGSYDWNADSNQVAMLLAAQKLGADTFEAFVNSPPWYWTHSGSSRGHDMPLANNLQKQHIAAFAAFCADVVEHFAKHLGIHFSSLSPFNEPGSPAWCLKMANKQEGCYFSRSRACKVLHALAQQPALQANNTQLVAFEQFCLRDTLNDVQHIPNELWNSLDRINLHTYTSKHFLPSVVRPYVSWQDNALWRRRVRKTGQKRSKSIWVSEFGSGRGAVSVAKQVIRDIAQLGPSAWVYWQAVEGPGAGWGLLEVPLEGHEPTAAAGMVAGTADTTAVPAATAGQDCNAGTAAVSSDTAAASNAGGLQFAGSRNVLDGGDSNSGVQQTASQIVLHPNYFVMQFITQCIPVGSTVYRIKVLGKCGILVQKSKQHWTLLYINTNKRQEQVLQIEAAALIAAATGRAHKQEVIGSDKQHSHCGVLQLTASAAGTAVDVAVPAAAAAHAVLEGSSGCAARQAHNSCSSGAQLNVQMLDIARLDRVTWHPGMPVTPSTGLGCAGNQKAQVFAQELIDSFESGIGVTVPPQHLCRVDVVLM